MIIGVPNLESAAIINKLHEAEGITFHLTGSRFFNHNHPNSDWDFFTQDNNETANFLINLGFEIQSFNSTEYRDVETAVVLRWTNSINQWIDVQLVKHVDVKIIAQRLLKERVFMHKRFSKDNYLNNEVKNLLWNSLYREARDILDELSMYR